jgi:hypothetical protein
MDHIRGIYLHPATSLLPFRPFCAVCKGSQQADYKGGNRSPGSLAALLQWFTWKHEDLAQTGREGTLSEVREIRRGVPA